MLKGGNLRLGSIFGDADAANIQSFLLEGVNQTQHIQIVGNAVVAPDFAADDIFGADHDDHFGLVLELQQHLQLGVRLKTGQHTGGMIVVKQLAAKFQIEFVVKLGDALADMLRLHDQVLLVIKADLHKIPSSPNTISIR